MNVEQRQKLVSEVGKPLGSMWERVKNSLILCTVALLIIATIFFILAGHYGCMGEKAGVDSFIDDGADITAYGSYNAGGSGPISIGSDYVELLNGAAARNGINQNPRYADCSGAGLRSDEVIAELHAQQIMGNHGSSLLMSGVQSAS